MLLRGLNSGHLEWFNNFQRFWVHEYYGHETILIWQRICISYDWCDNDQVDTIKLTVTTWPGSWPVSAKNISFRWWYNNWSLGNDNLNIIIITSQHLLLTHNLKSIKYRKIIWPRIHEINEIKNNLRSTSVRLD